ncbi:hypothetical protein PO118_16730 [Bacteroides thetaiotaomicron]|uniref:hypothetical protein n=1 Tax=Bacteroides thetaiotaomicron TaxID=818 RepID=UPI00232E4253|nr:hypothetical protein [Bacteroides thetaiotaomicron]MDC2279002.1 hypothetical protein [Bacteroides thetaiotaomicron]
MIKRYFISVMLLSCCLVEIFGQQEGRKNNQEDIFEESCRGNKESRLSEGSCKNVIKVLRAALENDSLAIETFKKEYEIINMSLFGINGLWKKNVSIRRNAPFTL